MNIYDTANQLERELRELEQFVAVKQAFTAIQEDEAAKKLFDEFRDFNLELQKKQMMGQEITEEEIKKVQELGQQATTDEKISNLMKAEQQLHIVIDDINRIFTKPLQEMYGVQ